MLPYSILSAEKICNKRSIEIHVLDAKNGVPTDWTLGRNGQKPVPCGLINTGLKLVEGAPIGIQRLLQIATTHIRIPKQAARTWRLRLCGDNLRQFADHRL